ncbi:MAG: ABC transporter permease [Planctomycetota bacterium]|nr:ABC transporter permease [Planctomycetota bacterium]
MPANSAAARRPPLLDPGAYRTLGLFIFLVVCLTAVSVSNPHFLDINNLKTMSSDAAILMLAAAGQLLVMLAGNIDISTSSIIAVSGFSSALLMRDHPETPLACVALLVIAIGLVLGLVNGVVIAYFDVPAIIVTLGTLSIYRGLNFLISKGGWVVSRDLPPKYTEMANGEWFGHPALTNMLAVALATALLTHLFLARTRHGRRLYAIGSDKANARLIGINVPGYVFFTYAVCGMLNGLAGGMWCSRYNFAQSSTGLGYEMTIIASCVIGGASVTGGRGSTVGMILGAIMLSVIIHAMNILQVSPFWKMFIQGAIILAAVILDSCMARKNRA